MIFDGQIIEATAILQNASNFNVSMKISGPSNDESAYSYGFLHRHRNKRSFAILCSTSMNRRERVFVFGERIHGQDSLLRFERQRVVAKSKEVHFPTHTFDFSDEDIDITYVKLVTDVS